ncbi:hypothetical protein OC835_000641 [Tilletia horrida]|nr:hypothetical protein OC835_000641 [Tilletia horrida]
MRVLPLQVPAFLQLVFPLLSLLSLLSTLAQATPTPAPAAAGVGVVGARAPGFMSSTVPGLHLNSKTFQPSTHAGAWLVEFYSPYCHHCQKFAPTWEDVSKMSAHLADSSQFRFARVDCIAQGDLCADQKVKWFPTVRLYYDGVEKGEYKGDRSYDDLTAYVKAKASDYRKIIAGRPAPPPPAAA